MSKRKELSEPMEASITQLAEQCSLLLVELSQESSYRGELSTEQRAIFEGLRRELEVCYQFTPAEAERQARYMAGGMSADLLRKIVRGPAQEPHVKEATPLVRTKARKEPVSLRGPRILQRVTSAFDLLAALVPKRVANEEIGDALEVVHHLVNAQRPKWMIYLKVVSTFFWVLTHAVLDWIIKAAGAAKAITGKSEGKDDK